MTWHEGEPPGDGWYVLEGRESFGACKMTKNEWGWWMGEEPQCYHLARWHGLSFDGVVGDRIRWQPAEPTPDPKESTE